MSPRSMPRALRPPARRGHVRAASARGAQSGDGTGAADAAAAQGRAAARARRRASLTSAAATARCSRLSAEAFVEPTRCWVSSTSRRSPPAATSASATAARATRASWQQLLAAAGVLASAVDPVTVDGETCSSTAIRAALADGLIEHASALLGYAYELEGIVRPGDRRGRDARLPHRQHPSARPAPDAAGGRRLCGRRAVRGIRPGGRAGVRR